MWQAIKARNGQTLFTLDQRKPFDLLAVAETYLTIRPHKTGQERRLARRDLEAAFALLQRKGELTRIDIQSEASGWSSAYVAALLAQLPGVSYRIRPIRLRLER